MSLIASRIAAGTESIESVAFYISEDELLNMLELPMHTKMLPILTSTGCWSLKFSWETENRNGQ